MDDTSLPGLPTLSAEQSNGPDEGLCTAIDQGAAFLPRVATPPGTAGHSVSVQKLGENLPLLQAWKDGESEQTTVTVLLTEEQFPTEQSSRRTTFINTEAKPSDSATMQNASSQASTKKGSPVQSDPDTLPRSTAEKPIVPSSAPVPAAALITAAKESSQAYGDPVHAETPPSTKIALSGGSAHGVVRLQGSGDIVNADDLHHVHRNGRTSDEARRNIEALLKDEAYKADVLLILQRRVVSRKDPLKYLTILQQEDAALKRWYENAFDEHARFEAAVVIQRKWIFGADTVQAALMLSGKMAKSRAQLRYELLDVLQLRDDIRTQAFEFFEQIAPPISRRVVEIKHRLQDMHNKAQKNSDDGNASVRITSTKHPAFNFVRTSQADLLACNLRLKGIQRKMIAFATREEMRLMNNADGDSGAISRELLKLKKLAVTPSRSEGRQGWNSINAKGTKAEERQLLLPSSIGPVRKTGKNALEDTRILREDMELIANASNDLLKVRNTLALLQAGRPLSEYEAIERAAATVASDAVTESQPSLLRSSSGRRKGAFLDPSRAGSGRPTSRSTRSLLPEQRAAGSSYGRPKPKQADANIVVSPLWICSPSAGWQADHAIACTSSQVATPGAPAGMSMDADSRLGYHLPAANASCNSTIPLDSMTSSSPPIRGGNLVADAYKRAAPNWNAVRYDLPTSSWIACTKPIEFPDPKAGAGGMKLRPTRSLPAFTWQTYTAPRVGYRPTIHGDFVPLRPDSPPIHSRPKSRVMKPPERALIDPRRLVSQADVDRLAVKYGCA